MATTREVEGRSETSRQTRNASTAAGWPDHGSAARKAPGHAIPVARSRPPSRRAKQKRDLRGAYLVHLGFALSANLALLGCYFLLNSPPDPAVPMFVATVDIFVAILVRNEIFLNVLYRGLVVPCRPSRVPVAIKNGVTAGLLHIGGIHAGCAVSSLVWLAVGISHLSSGSPSERHWAFLPIVSAIMMLLAVMCIIAVPVLRDRYHDAFEFSHRFFGWSVLVLLWANVLLVTTSSSQAATAGLLVSAINSASLWLAVLIAVLVLLPWLTVRKVHVQAQVLSKAVIQITFPGGSGPGMFGRISRHALGDWHAFAFVSDASGLASRMMIISAAGDFTRGLIATPPVELYVRTVGFPGLPYCILMYRRSIIIATGAGMAPYVSLLSVLPHGRHRLIWVGRAFREQFGDQLCDMVFRWQDLTLIDTATCGRPDMTALAVENYRSFSADAVFVGSNPEGTRQIVSGCRKLGIPAFGPSWDS
jgi:hypothetical protein